MFVLGYLALHCSRLPNIEYGRCASRDHDVDDQLRYYQNGVLQRVHCQEQACRSHCLCGRLVADGMIELASGRSAGRPQGRPAAAAAGEGAGAAVAANRYASRAAGVVPFQVAPAPVLPAAVPAPALAPVRVPAQRERSRSPPPTAEEEQRDYDRATIAGRFRRQWRGLDMADRPLPPRGRADSGIVTYGSWSDGLVGEAKKRTLELLKTDRWLKHKEHSSVHITMYLR